MVLSALLKLLLPSIKYSLESLDLLSWKLFHCIRCQKKKINFFFSIHIDRASVFHCYLFTLLLVVLDSVKPLCLHMIQRRIQESQRSLWLNLSIASNSIDLIDPVRMLQFRLMVGKSKQASMNSMHRLMK